MLAQELIALYDAQRETRPFTDTHPGLTPAAGYEAAAALHRHRLAPVRPGESWSTRLSGLPIPGLAVRFE